MQKIAHHLTGGMHGGAATGFAVQEFHLGFCCFGDLACRSVSFKIAGNISQPNGRSNRLGHCAQLICRNRAGLVARKRSQRIAATRRATLPPFPLPITCGSSLSAHGHTNLITANRSTQLAGRLSSWSPSCRYPAGQCLIGRSAPVKANRRAEQRCYGSSHNGSSAAIS